MTKHIVATVTEIPPGDQKIVEISGRSIGVYNINGEYFALLNRCPHQGGPLCLGIRSGFLHSDKPGEFSYTRRGEMVRCPWHGWEFDIKTGQSWFDPVRTRVRRYDVSVASGADIAPEIDEETCYQKGPYQAESFPVTVEEAYVIVEI